MLCMRHRLGLRRVLNLWSYQTCCCTAAAVLRRIDLVLLPQSFVPHALQSAGKDSCEKKPAAAGFTYRNVLNTTVEKLSDKTAGIRNWL